jgi:hypothetical protein
MIPISNLGEKWKKKKKKKRWRMKKETRRKRGANKTRPSVALFQTSLKPPPLHSHTSQKALPKPWETKVSPWAKGLNTAALNRALSAGHTRRAALLKWASSFLRAKTATAESGGLGVASF